jgi:hypothetical protein
MSERGGGGPHEILDDIVEEAKRLTDPDLRPKAPIRVLGGVAVALHAPGGLPPALARSYGDIDLVTTRKGGRDAIRFLEEMGYVANERFNAMNGGSRFVVYDTIRGRQIDVFAGEFRMCHTLPIADRLELEQRTVPLAELLLTKLQIVRLNAKDLRDIWAIVLEHDVAGHDDDAINAAWTAKLLSGDWGLWRTARDNVQLARERVPESGLDADQGGIVSERLQTLWDAVEAQPKSMRWRSRARVGDRVKWYDEPEEIAHERGGNHES